MTMLMLLRWFFNGFKFAVVALLAVAAVMVIVGIAGFPLVVGVAWYTGLISFKLAVLCMFAWICYASLT